MPGRVILPFLLLITPFQDFLLNSVYY